MVPEHIAIIMDGNRRWAKKRGEPVATGHLRGAEVIDDIVRVAGDLGVKVLTLFAFSTENWGRPREEVSVLMELFAHFLEKKREMLIKEGVRLETIGDVGRLPEKLQKTIRGIKEATKEGKKIDLVLAMNYGGRNEIVRAAQKAAATGEISEESLSAQLDTAQWPDPALLIRTSGECRVSNFLLWQISYSEIVVVDRLWPDFTGSDLTAAIQEYQRRERRLGE